MKTAQRQSAIDRVEETITVLESFIDAGRDSVYRGYRAKIAANIVDAVIALTADRTPEELAKIAQSMRHSQERWSRLKKAETHS